ncbi:hypothetical protein ACFQY7_44630 [Actinomadura luteofluorescens]|uniref:hypothetical protein n=1 Tax=Actinomadura luteofluorescens TaxID=46163 RepID=UPI00363F1F7B
MAANNVAQASRFTVSYEVHPDDIPANEWLISTYGETAETVLEWWKNDIDDEGRDWVTKRTMERLIKLHRAEMPLQPGLMYLGDGEYAPVPLSGLEARLADRRRIGLVEIAEDRAGWEARLAKAAETSREGTDDTDLVHQVFSNAEVSQLERHLDVVARLLPYLPPKLRATYLVGQTRERQRFWVAALARMAQLSANGRA